MSVQTTAGQAKCSHCGALQEIGMAGLSVRCDYCGSPLESEPIGGGSHPDSIAPAVLSEEAARNIFRQWLQREHEDVPREFAARAKLTELHGEYWPFYFFSGVYSGWCANRGSISGGFSELELASAELMNRRMESEACRFFSPPRYDVSLEDLSKRVMIELFDELRAVVHVDFCQSVLRFRTQAPLRDFRGVDTDPFPLKPFTEPFEVAERRLKEMLGNRAHVKDIYFPQLSVKRIYWPFWTAEFLYEGRKYFMMMDASSDGGYRGGYKPVDPDKAKLDLHSLLDADNDDLLHLFMMSGEGADGRGKRGFSKIVEVNVGGENSCFVATAAYGSPLASEVVLLRAYRDRILRNTRAGRAFIAVYYAVSPPLARLIRRANILRSLARWALRPVIAACRSQMEHG